MHGFFDRIKADHDAPEAISLQTLLTGIFDRLTQSPGYTFEDLSKITAPTLILTGARDVVCSVEEGVGPTGCCSKESWRFYRTTDTSSRRPPCR